MPTHMYMHAYMHTRTHAQVGEGWDSWGGEQSLKLKTQFLPVLWGLPVRSPQRLPDFCLCVRPEEGSASWSPLRDRTFAAHPVFPSSG